MSLEFLNARINTFRFVLERFWKPIAWLTRVIDTDRSLSAGKPRMWWTFLPFTLNRQLKNVYKCK